MSPKRDIISEGRLEGGSSEAVDINSSLKVLWNWANPHEEDFMAESPASALQVQPWLCRSGLRSPLTLLQQSPV